MKATIQDKGLISEVLDRTTISLRELIENLNREHNTYHRWAKTDYDKYIAMDESKEETKDTASWKDNGCEECEELENLCNECFLGAN